VESSVSLIMKGFLFSLAIAALLAIVTGVACLLLNLVYVNWFHVPIETLAVMVFFSKVAPCIFVLSIPYAIGSRWIFGRRGVAVGSRQFFITLAVGTLITILILAIVFPCDAQPYFVGGYLMKSWFGGQ
jgi:hypothetical protein